MSPVRHEFVHNPVVFQERSCLLSHPPSSPHLGPIPGVDPSRGRYSSLRRAPSSRRDRFGFELPEITVHLDAVTTPARPVNLSPVSAATLISTKGTAHQAGARWVVERTTSWHNRGFRKLHICTETRPRARPERVCLCPVEG